MKVKSITFYDYALAKKGNEHKSYSEIFDIPWKNSDKGLRVRESRKRTTSLLFTVFVIILPSILAFIPSTKVFAGTLDMDTFYFYKVVSQKDIQHILHYKLIKVRY